MESRVRNIVLCEILFLRTAEKPAAREPVLIPLTPGWKHLLLTAAGFVDRMLKTGGRIYNGMARNPVLRIAEVPAFGTLHFCRLRADENVCS